MTLNEATLNRLKRISGILQKGHRAHQSFKIIYILVSLLGIIAVIALVELFLWNRQVSLHSIRIIQKYRSNHYNSET